MIKRLILLIFIFVPLAIKNNSNPDRDYHLKKYQRFESLLMSLMDFESRFDEKAINPKTKASGILQQYKIHVLEANRILGYKKYNYDDRFNMEKAIEMFKIVQDYWNPEYDIEKGARLHGGGFLINTDNYYKNFLVFYEKYD